MSVEAPRRRRIIAGIDFSRASFAATQWIARWLVRDDELVLVHSLVVPEFQGILAGKFPLPPSLLENARDGAERRLRAFSATLPLANISIEIRDGRPADTIADVAREKGADLVVVGKHGEHGPLRGYTGRTADNLVRSAPAPVLMASGIPPGDPRRVVVALTYSSITPFILECVKRIQAASGAEIIAINVVGSAVLSHVLTMSSIRTGTTPGNEELREIFSEDRDRWCGQLIDAGVPADKVSAEVVFGEVSESVIAAAREYGADMIIMGSHAGPVRRRILGSAASAVLRHAEIPVLVAVEPEQQEFSAGDSFEASTGVGDEAAVFTI